MVTPLGPIKVLSQWEGSFFSRSLILCVQRHQFFYFPSSHWCRNNNPMFGLYNSTNYKRSHRLGHTFSLQLARSHFKSFSRSSNSFALFSFKDHCLSLFAVWTFLPRIFIWKTAVQFLVIKQWLVYQSSPLSSETLAATYVAIHTVSTFNVQPLLHQHGWERPLHFRV